MAAAVELLPGGLPRCVAAYVRVSSKSQDYEYQKQAIEKACKARGESVHRWYADVASGRSMDRPQLQRLRDAVRARAIGKVWVWRLDRLTRSGIVDTLSAIQELRRHECTIESVAESWFAGDGGASEVVLAVLAWAAQIEREKIRENQAAARARMVSEGRSWGRPAVSRELIQAIESAALRSPRPSQRSIARVLKCSKSLVGRVIRDFVRQAAAENMLFEKS